MRDRKEYDLDDFLYLFELALAYDEQDTHDIPLFCQLSATQPF